MSPPTACLILSGSTPFPPKPPIISPPPKQPYGHHQGLHRFRINSSRREATALSLLAAIVPCLQHPAASTALSIGISGPKEWLREQKKKSSKFLLAPIDASRNSLSAAYLLLTKGGSDLGDSDLEEVQKLLRSAARDCVPEDRNSFVTFQARTGVEVCTFRLILKNASSLLEDKDPLKLEAEVNLTDLLRSFASLNSMANETDIQLPSSRQKVADALMATITFLNKFEQGVKDCLEI
ncbi:uncharacterized protein LOC127807970 [Diospyros lotus]|uniref:uncharacterized protein LOC127807970 n=1 Tax=Diospyros lotus TaxID=55363 RepID=UPI002253635C|nr:uncharacterized protein LOC127807970 [Diospyros lotus]XP_052202199.1 uncharacterized protein LOC127807970 [Diospyros lotus]